MNEVKTVGIIHGSPLIRDGVAGLLGRQPGVRIIGTFESARAAMDQGLAGDPILLYDHGTCRQDGPELLAEMRQRLPNARILMFGVADDDQAIIECVQAGTGGCILLDASTEDLMAAVRSLDEGTPPVSPRVVTTLFSYVSRLRAGEDSPPPSSLTAREEQILQLIAKGLSNKEIAQRLYLQPQTVKNYVHQVLQKLNLRNRLEVIRSMRSPKQ